MIDITLMTCKNESIGKHEPGEKILECRECLNHMNWVRLMLKPNTDLPLQDMLGATAGRTMKFVHDMSLQESFVYMKMLQVMAAQASIIYSEKTRKEQIPDPKALERKADDWQRAQEEMKHRQRPAKEKKMLTDFDKAVAALTSVGVPELAAIASIKQRFEKQGKIVPTGV